MRHPQNPLPSGRGVCQDTHSEDFEEGLSEEGQSSGEYAVVWIALIAIALGVFILLLIGEI